MTANETSNAVRVAKCVVQVILHLAMLAAVVALWDTGAPQFIYVAF